MHAMARPLLRRFGWPEQEFRYAATYVPPSGPPATRLVIDRADQQMGWEGATHGTGRTPDRNLDIGPAETDIVGRLFVTVPATTITGTVAALKPWLPRVEPSGACVDPGRAVEIQEMDPPLPCLGPDWPGPARSPGPG